MGVAGSLGCNLVFLSILSNLSLIFQRLVLNLCYILTETPCMSLLVLNVYIDRAEGSSKIHSRLEQQTSRLSQQMKGSSSNSSSHNKSSASSKSSPPKEKTSPASPMDDIERGNTLSGRIP